MVAQHNSMDYDQYQVRTDNKPGIVDDLACTLMMNATFLICYYA